MKHIWNFLLRQSMCELNYVSGIVMQPLQVLTIFWIITSKIL